MQIDNFAFVDDTEREAHDKLLSPMCFHVIVDLIVDGVHSNNRRP